MAEAILRTILAIGALVAGATAVTAQAPFDPSAALTAVESPGITVIDTAKIGEAPRDTGADELPALFGLGGPDEWTKPERLSSTLQVMLLMTVISLAPAVLLMTTSFVRVIVVLALLRQALGTQQAPPSQVLTSIALFVTLLVMTPVWTQSYEQGIKPYTDGQLTMEEAFDNASDPLRKFMGDQIDRTDNHDTVRMFLARLPDTIDPETGDFHPNYYYDNAPPEGQLVPLSALLPAYMLSELKTAFLIGFQVYLPFVILDIVVASVTISMGMLMLPPVLISLPFKLMLFVLLDGWKLVIGMLLESIAW